MPADTLSAAFARLQGSKYQLKNWKEASQLPEGTVKALSIQSAADSTLLSIQICLESLMIGLGSHYKVSLPLPPALIGLQAALDSEDIFSPEANYLIALAENSASWYSIYHGYRNNLSLPESLQPTSSLMADPLALSPDKLPSPTLQQASDWINDLESLLNYCSDNMVEY